MGRMKNKAAFLLAALLFCAACHPTAPDELQPTGGETESVGETVSEAETEPETTPETEPESETETETETEITLPNEAEMVTDPVSDITAFSDDPEEETLPETTPPETEPPEPEEPTEPPRIFNYLNGKTTTAEEQAKRPVAIMINNIRQSLPQVGITAGDMYYECSAEGGITRIMMLVSDYESLGVVGSVRSSRDYFVDFLANHDAIYVHAGGSEQAYAKIMWRGIHNLDGVNMYLPGMFYRDSTRLYNMGYEHSLMTTGESIAAAIANKNYPTEHDETFVSPFQFYDETVDNKLAGSPASHVHMRSTPIQTVDFVYNEETGEYLRYQYNGMPHVDGETGEQLSLKNVIILFTDINPIPGDTAGRLSVGTVGSGQGYYITNGKRKVINWTRTGKTTPIHMEYRNGDELILNAGKTFICVVDNSVAAGIDFEYSFNP